jgi:sugar phosphate isomerase/epimerase
MDVDIGDFTRAGHDALQFVKDNYTHLLDVHLKDCKFQGVSVPFGQGDSHMKEVLQFLRDKKLHVRANIDCDYPGTGSSVDEVKKCFDYVKSCLA